jgi:hypothetical protein
MPTESISQNNIKLEEKINKWSQDFVSYLVNDGFEVTPADASFLRQILIPSLLAQNPNRGFLATLPEIFEKFFLLLYGINTFEYFQNSQSTEEDEKRKKGLYEYVQTKIRRE